MKPAEINVFNGILCVGSLLAEQYANIALRLMENPWASRRVVIHGVKLRRLCSFPRPALTLRFVLTIDLRIGRLVRTRMPHNSRLLSSRGGLRPFSNRNFLGY